jgi:hypothetical protein
MNFDKKITEDCNNYPGTDGFQQAAGQSVKGLGRKANVGACHPASQTNPFRG